MGQSTEIITLDLTVDEYQRIRHALSTEAGRCREVAEDCRRHIAEYGIPESDRATPENWEEKAAAALDLMNKLNSIVPTTLPNRSAENLRAELAEAKAAQAKLEAELIDTKQQWEVAWRAASRAYYRLKNRLANVQEAHKRDRAHWQDVMAKATEHTRMPRLRRSQKAQSEQDDSE